MTYDERLRLVTALVQDFEPRTPLQWGRVALRVPRLIDKHLTVSADYAKVLWNIAQREGVANAQ